VDFVDFAENAALARVEVERWLKGASTKAKDYVAAEVPVALEYNGISHAVMMASPCDLEDFAVGFSISEGIVSDLREIYEIDVREVEPGIQVCMRIAAERFAGLKERRRNLTGRTGCGLCGTESLQEVFRPLQRVNSLIEFGGEALHKALAKLCEHQYLQGVTGATHAAAWINDDGKIVCAREDVGRHNALDKLIGALARKNADFASGAVIITSRASYEMVQKAASVGIGIVAAVSAPTSLAVQLADSLNVTLVGFLRPGNHVVYTHAQRLTEPES
jgi:FdhD protein